MKGRLGGLALLAMLALGVDAEAFCLARGCDPREEKCAVQDGCITTGPPLFWWSSCVTVSVQGDGSAAHGIDFRAFQRVTYDAFKSWEEGLDCGGGKAPNLDVQVLGPAECDAPTYNEEAGNANVIMIRDEDWPYEGGVDELGHTTITFDPESGEIWDVDIEINGGGVPITLGASDSGVELASIITHEAGHFFGLAHSTDKAATMFPNTDFGNTELASLAEDDIQGICSIYPPDEEPSGTSCSPRNGYSDTCAGGPRRIAPNPLPGEPLFCALRPGFHARPQGAAWLLFAALLTGVGRARRRSAR